MNEPIKLKPGVNVFALLNQHLQGINEKLKHIWELGHEIKHLRDKVEYPQLVGVPDLSRTVMKHPAFQLGCIAAVTHTEMRNPYEGMLAGDLHRELWELGYRVQKIAEGAELRWTQAVADLGAELERERAA